MSWVNRAFYNRFKSIRHRWIETSTSHHFRLDYLQGNGKDEVAAMIKAVSKDKKILEAPMQEGIQKLENELTELLLSGLWSDQDCVKFLDNFKNVLRKISLKNFPNNPRR